MATPTEHDKVISIDLNLTATDIFKMSPYDSKEQFFNTDVGSSFLEFKAGAVPIAGATARLTLKNHEDGSLIQRVETVEAEATSYYYQMKAEELIHVGRWIAEVTFLLPSGAKIMGRSLRFKIDGDIISGLAPLVIVSDVNALAEDLSALYDDLTTLITSVELAEGIRNEAETTRGTVFTDSQTARTLAFNQEQALKQAQFNDAQTARANAFNDSEESRGTTFVASESARTVAFNATQLERKNAFDLAQSQRDDAFKIHDSFYAQAVVDENARKAQYAQDVLDVASRKTFYDQAVLDENTRKAYHTDLVAQEIVWATNEATRNQFMIDAGEQVAVAVGSANTASQAMTDVLAMLGTSIATLVDGKLAPSQIPALAINETFPVLGVGELTGLNAQRGDVAYIIVDNVIVETYMLATDNPSNLGDWLKLGVSYVGEAGHAETATNAENAYMINGSRIVRMTQAQYDLAVKDPDTIYIVTTA